LECEYESHAHSFMTVKLNKCSSTFTLQNIASITIEITELGVYGLQVLLYIFFLHGNLHIIWNFILYDTVSVGIFYISENKCVLIKKIIKT